MQYKKYFDVLIADIMFVSILTFIISLFVMRIIDMIDNTCMMHMLTGMLLYFLLLYLLTQLYNSFKVKVV